MRCTMIVGSLLITLVGAVGSLANEATPSEATSGEKIERRYGVEADLPHYPQSDPQQTIRSVIKATAKGNIEYMLAHLVSPTQVDEKLGGSQQAFEKLAVKPSPKKAKILIDSMKRQLSDGTWTIRRNLAWAKVDGMPDLSLEKIGNRWFMHNRPVAVPSD